MSANVLRPENILFSPARDAQGRGAVHIRRMARHNPRNTRVPPFSEAERARLMTEVRRHGEQSAAARIGVNKQTIARALARLPILPGSVLLLRTGLAALDPSPTAPEAA